jgi:hypothetical protein
MKASAPDPVREAVAANLRALKARARQLLLRGR